MGRVLPAALARVVRAFSPARMVSDAPAEGLSVPANIRRKENTLRNTASNCAGSIKP
jgi:hypothetical protein